ncbi:heterokaryon incompatibility protein-domain-containing protein [Xylaria nigripes]|nr:heterokaryon incompatibility protein-domain-containing protein [Xylaria nigripes]
MSYQSRTNPSMYTLPVSSPAASTSVYAHTGTREVVDNQRNARAQTERQDERVKIPREQQRRVQAPFNEHAVQQMRVWETPRFPSISSPALTGEIRVQTPFNKQASQQPPVREHWRRTHSFSVHAPTVGLRMQTPFKEPLVSHNSIWNHRRPAVIDSKASIREIPGMEGLDSIAASSSMAGSQSTLFTKGPSAPHATASPINSIRLLKFLLPTAHEKQDAAGTLKYSLVTFPYAHCPDYIGLSYVWGEETPTSFILVDGKTVPVRHNLKQALLSISKSDPEVYVWADAICINQQDDREKSSLVQHMGEIFANAKFVYAWLGPIESATEDSSTEDLFNHLARLGSLFWKHAGLEGHRKLNERRINLDVILAKTLDTLFDLFAPQHQEGFPVEEYSAFSARSFWSRIWVLQEVYLAQNLYYICGHRRLVSQTVAGALILLETFQRHLIRSQGQLRDQIEANEQLAKFAFGFPSLPEMHRLIIYTSIYPLDVVSLRIAMTNFCVKELPTGSKATDPRDMIYGLMGFANHEEKAYIQADYSKSVQETYASITRRMIQNGFTDILAWAQPKNKSIEDLPSWVPDYSSSIYESLCSQGQAKPWLPQFRACGETRYHEPTNYTDPLKLPVHGRRIGEILRVGSDWFPRARAHAAFPSSSTDGGEVLLARSASHDDLLAFLAEIREFGQHAQRILGHFVTPCSVVPELTWRVPCCDQTVADGKLVRQDPATRVRYEATLTGLEACKDHPSLELPPQSRHYVEALLRWANKRPFLTTNGFVGLGPTCAQPGDTVVVLDGFSACYVLRCLESVGRNECSLVGEAYVDGAMDGEMTWSGPEGYEWFYLV